jgi:hypothetical protein
MSLINGVQWIVTATKRYTYTVIGISGRTLFGVSNMLLGLIRRHKMSKILATLIAGLFAASVFAADIPKADVKPVPAATSAATAKTPVAGGPKKVHKHHKHGKKAAVAAPAAVPAK